MGGESRQAALEDLFYIQKDLKAEVHLTEGPKNFVGPDWPEIRRI